MSGLQLDLSQDHLAASVACVVQEQQNPKTENAQGLVFREDDDTVHQKPARIELSDCLACSGCITSAESVLIQQQSVQTLQAALAKYLQSPESPTLLFISISPQTRATFMVKYGFENDGMNNDGQFERWLYGLVYYAIYRIWAQLCESNTEIMKHLPSSLNDLKSKIHVRMADTSIARELSHLALIREFQERTTGPLLTSACPGWICYAEKQHPQVLPFISRVKSPQQIMGQLVKRSFVESNNHENTLYQNVYHVSLMPCFDKKLEASRSQSVLTTDNDDQPIKEVDLVISSVELENWCLELGFPLPHLLQQHVNLSKEHSDLPKEANEWTHGWSESLFSGHTQKRIESAPNDSIELNVVKQIRFTNPGTGAGGYLDVLVHHLLSESPELQHQILRVHEDWEENLLVDTNNEVKCRMIRAYGFRHLTNAVRMIKRQCGLVEGSGKANASMIRKRNRRLNIGESSTEERDLSKVAVNFIEIMACPAGCLNGGAQLKPFASSSSQTILPSQIREFVQKMHKYYIGVSDVHYAPENPTASSLFTSLISPANTSSNHFPADYDSIFYTSYQAVEGLAPAIKAQSGATEMLKASTDW